MYKYILYKKTMKKILSLILVTLFLSVGFVYAVPQLNYFSFTSEDILGHLEKFYNDKTISNNIKSEILVKTIKEANRQLSEIGAVTNSSPVNTGNTGCQKISQVTWKERGCGLFACQELLKSDVTILQTFLSKWEYANGSDGNMSSAPDKIGVYGLTTEERVKLFQRTNGIKQTGAVGPQTLAKINSMICGNVNQTSSQEIIHDIKVGNSGLMKEKNTINISWKTLPTVPKNARITFNLKRASDGYQGYLWPYAFEVSKGMNDFTLNCLYDCANKNSKNSSEVYFLTAQVSYCSNESMTDPRFCEQDTSGNYTGYKTISKDITSQILNQQNLRYSFDGLKLESFQQ